MYEVEKFEQFLFKIHSDLSPEHIHELRFIKYIVHKIVFNSF